MGWGRWNGRIDELASLDCALSDNEVADLYQAGLDDNIMQNSESHSIEINQMNQRWIHGRLRSAFACAILTLFACVAQAADDRPPNVVFLFADDLGYGDLGCYGHPYAKTPALDQLAKEGTRFTQFYVTGVTCNPSRTGLMTGLFPARFPKYAADFGFGDRTTITELLKQRGYKTGHFGKWHIGPKETEVDGTYGIDTVKVIGKSRDEEAGRDDDLYSAAIDFIKDHKDSPFYINVWGHATHFPVDTPDSLVAEFNDTKVDRDDFCADHATQV